MSKRKQVGISVALLAVSAITVAAYSIGTGKDMDATRRFAAERPEVWEALLDRLTSATVGFLGTLVADGADLYQLFIDAKVWELTVKPT